MQLEEFLQRSAQRTPEKPALVCGEHRLSYGELDRLSDKLACALAELGIRRGERVVVCLENSVEAAVSIFGILKAGATLVMVDATTKAERLGYILNDCAAAALILRVEKLKSLTDCLATAACLRTIFYAGAANGQLPDNKLCVSLDKVLSGAVSDGRRLPRKGIDADLAALIYTSGSTGRPKGAMLTHLNMVSAANSIVSYLENTAEDVILSVLPVSYSYGLYQLIASSLVGYTVVLERDLRFPLLLLEKIKKEHATGMPIVPTIAALLLRYDLTRHDLSSLRYITNAGAALPSEHVRRLRKAIPQAKLFLMYGQTECIRISYLPPDQVDLHPDSVGIAIPNEEVYLVDAQGQPVGPGVVGELVVRGSHVMRGYWGLPKETGKALRPGPITGEKVLYTGDMFRSENGYLYFVSRRDNIIKTRGEKVSPKEVEEVLYSLPEIAEAAVAGVPDEVMGQAIKAVIVLRDGAQLTAKEILGHCARHLEDFKVPRQVEFRNSLPKTPNGKIQLAELKTSVAEQLT